MKQLVIFGTGATAKLAHFYFTRDSQYDVVAFCVDGTMRDDESFLDLPLVDFEHVSERYPPEEHELFVAIGYGRLNRLRAGRFDQARSMGYHLASYVSSHCTWLSDDKPGENCFILEDNTIQPFVRMGNNITLWSGNHIGHDSVIEDHCFITSHVVVSGFVHIKPCCFVGVNATLRNGITIAPRTLIGAGAVIMEDTVEEGVYVPPRAKMLNRPSTDIPL